MTRTQAELAVLAQAMQIECEGMAFYGQAASESVNSRARELFQSLVADETTHLKILQAEYDSINGTGEWIAASTALPQIAPALTVFPKGQMAVERAASVPSDLEASSLAMGIEQKGYDLYAKAAKETLEADADALYGRLAKMESSHYKALQDAYGYLTHPDHWFDDAERPIFEG